MKRNLRVPTKKTSNNVKNSELEKKALNPQPLPPKAKKSMSEKALNPQPLPPKERKTLGRKALNQ